MRGLAVNFWETLWLVIGTFFFIMYLMVLFQIISDVFRDSSLGGGAKAVWLFALIFIPVLTALIYLVARGGGMSERQLASVNANRAATESYIRSVAATDATAQIASAKSLLDSGAITATEFEQLKASALKNA